MRLFVGCVLLFSCAPPPPTPAPSIMMPTQTCPAGSPVLVNQVRNARDLGGLLATSGATRCGVIFRSAAPTTLDAAACAELTRLGISTFIDLRESSEWMSLPDGVCPGVTVVHAPLPIPYSLSAADYLADLHADASMKLVFETMANAPGGVLFHCTYGRDRSGVVAALLLRALGVNRADVLTDYSRTTENGLGGTPPSLEAVLDELDRTGGARAHLTRIGVSDELWNALASRFVF